MSPIPRGNHLIDEGVPLPKNSLVNGARVQKNKIQPSKMEDLIGFIK